MNWKHKLACRLSNHVGYYYKHRRNGLRILAYHSVGAPAYRDKMELYDVSPSMFEEHIKSLEKYQDLYVRSLKKTEVDNSRLSIAFSFDDGYINNLKYVAPLMEKYKYPWHVFVVTDFIKNKNKGFMAPADLKELSAYKYVTIGSHGKTHSHLSECDNLQLKQELQDSKKYLEDILSKEINSISYPYGSANMRVIDSARVAGYKVGCSSHANINHSNRDMMCLSRTPIFSYDTTRTFEQKMFGMWDWMKYFTCDPLVSG
jgi:peptidoglycan/xylan/chitin deacetylase (PgdA/CDA1 family)